MTSKVDAIKSAWQQDPNVAQRYKMAENATRPFARTMVQLTEKLTSLKTTPVEIFDLGSGTGAVEAEIYDSLPKESWPDLKILAGDISPPMLEFLKQRSEEEAWGGVTTKVVDGSKLDESGVGDTYAHIFVGFAIFVMPPGTVKQLVARLVPGGTLAITTWAYLPWFSLLARTYAEMEDGPIMPTEEELWQKMTNGQAWHKASFIKEQLEEAGLEKVEVVQWKENVDCGTPDLFMKTFGFVVTLLSTQWPEEKRGAWTKEVVDTMAAILVKDVGGVDQHLFMEFEGIVGAGLKQ